MTLEFYSNHILSKTFEFDFDSNFPRWLPPLNEFHQRKNIRYRLRPPNPPPLRCLFLNDFLGSGKPVGKLSGFRNKQLTNTHTNI
jgi:hypothetical protein